MIIYTIIYNYVSSKIHFWLYLGGYMKKFSFLSTSLIIYIFCIINITYLFFFVNKHIANTFFLIFLFIFSLLSVSTSILSSDAHHSSLLCTIGTMNGSSFLFINLCLLLLNHQFNDSLKDITDIAFIYCYILFIISFCLATLLVIKYFDRPHQRRFTCYIYIVYILGIFTLYLFSYHTILPYIEKTNLPTSYYPLLCLILCILTVFTTYMIAKTKNFFVDKNNVKLFTFIVIISAFIIINFLIGFYLKSNIIRYLYMILQVSLFFIFFKMIISDSILQYSKDLTQRLALYSKNNAVMNQYLQHISEKNQTIQKQYHYVDSLYSQMMFFYPNALFIIVDHNIYHANEHASTLLKCENIQSILHTPFLTYIAPDYLEPIDKIISKLYKHAIDSETIELKMINLDNELVEVECYLTLSHSNEPRAIIISAKDISYKKQHDKLQQDIALEKMKLEFFCTISHELKTPVNIIYSATQLQNNFITQEEYNKIPTYNTMINQNCMRLLRLLNNFLDINRIESHYFNTTPRTLNIVTLTESLLDSTLPYMERKQITPLFDTEEEEIFCTIDTDLLERALLNLLSNAIKYTLEGGHINVLISLEGNYVCIHIQDDGVGIPLESQEFIFKRFTRIENGLVRKAEGAGIGLSLVKSFVELNKGTIHVQSTVGEGTEFIIRLPIETNSELLKDFDSTYTTHSEKVDIEFSDVYLS